MKNFGQDMISSFEIIRRISGDKWKFLIITYLFNGKRRFSELLYYIDSISKKVLAENLRELEHLGILYRITYDDPTPKVEYSLTKPQGEKLLSALQIMQEIGVEYMRRHGMEETLQKKGCCAYPQKSK